MRKRKEGRRERRRERGKKVSREGRGKDRFNKFIIAFVHS